MHLTIIKMMQFTVGQGLYLKNFTLFSGPTDPLSPHFTQSNLFKVHPIPRCHCIKGDSNFRPRPPPHNPIYMSQIQYFQIYFSVIGDMDFSVIGDMDVHKLHHFLGSPPFTQIYLFQVILIHFTNFVYNQYNSDI